MLQYPCNPIELGRGVKRPGGGRPSFIMVMEEAFCFTPPPYPVEGGDARMMLSFVELMALGMFIISLITLVILISDHIHKK